MCEAIRIKKHVQQNVLNINLKTLYQHVFYRANINLISIQ